MPISRWVPAIAAATGPGRSRPASVVPPSQYCRTKLMRGDHHADHRGDERGDGQAGRRARQHPQQHARSARTPAAVPTSAMLVMLRPSAVTPPSANTSACTTSTTDTQSAPTHGPTSIAASAPPSRWPLTPGQHREVEHLDGEDERGDQPGHRGQPVVEVAARPRRMQYAKREHGERGVRDRDTGPSSTPFWMCSASSCTGPPLSGSAAYVRHRAVAQTLFEHGIDTVERAGGVFVRHTTNTGGIRIVIANGAVAEERPLTRLLTFVDPVTGCSGYLAYDRDDCPIAAGGCRMRPGLTAEELMSLAARMSVKQRVLGINVDGAQVRALLRPAGHRLRRGSPALHRLVARGAAPPLQHGKRHGDPVRRPRGPCRRVGLPSVKYAVRAAQGLAEDDFRRRMRVLDTRVGAWTVGQRRAGHGLAAAVLTAARLAGHRARGLRVGLQGFGTLGRAAGYSLAEARARVVAVADVFGCVSEPGGLDLARLLTMDQSRPVHESTVARRRLPPVALFDQPVDVLVLAAGADALSARQAATLPAPVVVVGANCGLERAGRAGARRPRRARRSRCSSAGSAGPRRWRRSSARPAPRRRRRFWRRSRR